MTNVVQAAPTTQKVLIVNGNPEVLGLLETVLAAGHYDVGFVESGAHAYSQIKRVQPDLVILCANIDDANGFQVLSMLKLDPETRSIPVLTHTTDGDESDEEEETSDAADVEMFAPRPALVRMN